MVALIEPEPNRVQVRARIVGTYMGRPFEYVDPEGDDGCQYIWYGDYPSTGWWSTGNLSCDCNRWRFLPEEWRPEGEPCGETIMIDRVEPLDPKYPTLVLNETTEGRG